MNKKWNIKILLIIFMSSTMLTGCWNYNDIEKYSLVSGMSIDKDKKENKYLINVEVMDFEMSGKEAKYSSKIIESQGITIFDAIRNIINVTGKKLYWGHAKIIIIGKDIAEEGITPVLDLSYRDAEMREEMVILISKEATARELLGQETMTTDLRAYELDKMLEGQKSLSKIPKVKIYQLIENMEEGIPAALPSVGIVVNAGKRTAELMGTAIFKGDKLEGFLNEDESQQFLFITNHVKRGVLVEKVFDNGDYRGITLEVFRNKTRLKPQLIDGKLVMNIDIHTVVSIGEVETQEDYIGEEGRKKLIAIAQASLEVSLKNLIKKVQGDYDADIFGFRKIVKANMPSIWRSMESNWDDDFKNLNVKVNVKIDIKNSALNSKTIKVER